MAAVVGLVASPVLAAPITINDAYHFVDRVGTRSWAPGFDRLALTFGVFEINLNSTEGTSGTYEQGTVSGTLFDASTSLNKQFAARVDYDTELTRSWTLRFQNEGDTAVFVTPEVGDADAPEFTTEVTQSGSGTTPTFNFTPPEGIDRLQIQILNLNEVSVGGISPDIFFQENLDNGETSFTVPDGVLEDGGVYSIAFQADTFRNDATSSLLGRSRVWYDFVAGDLPDTGGEPVFLPTTDTTSGTPIFNFDNPVVKEELAFYDPLVAIGYDYAIGEGDPLFHSVELPFLGDDLYELLLPDGSGGFTFLTNLMAGVEYVFDTGVEAFRVLGIEPSLSLDPFDNTAFVTGLSFKDDGRFTGTMTPITVDVAPIPLPATGLLLIGGVGVLALRRRVKTTAT